MGQTVVQSITRSNPRVSVSIVYRFIDDVNQSSRQERVGSDRWLMARN